MITRLAIGTGAGAASALLYFAIVSGTTLSMALFYVAPLPILITGLGWGAAAGFTAAIVGGVLAAAVSTPLLGLAFFTLCSGPAAWLAYLALLNRPADPANPASPRIWYPAGRLALWAAAGGALSSAVALAAMGTGTEGLVRSLRLMLDSMAADGTLETLGVTADADRTQIAQTVATLLPPFSAALWTLGMLFNLWLAAQVTAMSEAPPRPVPVVRHIDVPRAAAGALLACLAASFLPGTPGLVGIAAAAALMSIYLIQGLAVFHVLTHGSSSRTVMLILLYGLLVLLSVWIVPLVVALGVAETFARFRDQAAAARQADGT